MVLPKQRFFVVPPFLRQSISLGKLAARQLEGHLEAIRVHVVKILHPT